VATEAPEVRTGTLFIQLRWKKFFGSAFTWPETYYQTISHIPSMVFVAI